MSTYRFCSIGRGLMGTNCAIIVSRIDVTWTNRTTYTTHIGEWRRFSCNLCEMEARSLGLKFLRLRASLRISLVVLLLTQFALVRCKAGSLS